MVAAQTLSSCVKTGLFFIEVHGVLIAVGFSLVEHKLQVNGLQQLKLMGSVVVVHGL